MSLFDRIGTGLGVDGLGEGFKVGFKLAAEGGVVKAEGGVCNVDEAKLGLAKEGCESVVVPGVLGEVTVVTAGVEKE